MKQIALLVFLFAVSGCASLGDKFTAKETNDKSKALIYIYRVSKFAGSAWSPDVALDDKVVGDLPSDGYFPIEVTPGDHKLAIMPVASKTPTGTFFFHVKKGEEYYVRYDVSNYNGVSESQQNAQRAGLMGAGIHNGGGAIGGAMSAAAGAFFLGNEKEKAQLVAQLDTRAQSSTLNPGFLFVKPAFGKNEIRNAKLRTWKPPSPPKPPPPGTPPPRNN